MVQKTKKANKSAVAKPIKKVKWANKIEKREKLRMTKIKPNRAQGITGHVGKKSKKNSKLEFDEDAIKSRINTMLEDYTEQGGPLLANDDQISPGFVDSDIDSVQEEKPGILKKNDSQEKRAAKREKKKKFDFERNDRTVFVGNLPKTMSQKDIVKLFKTCGSVEAARIRNVIPEKEKLAPKVALLANKIHPKVDSFNAYIVFTDVESVKKALDMNGKLVENHHIRVDRATRPKAKKETLTSRKKSIFVGNLRFDIRDDDLINHFEKVGSVNYVRIVRDRTTGLGKGFGFVVFHERASVKKALELNETNFKGRNLRVKKVDKETKMKVKK